jgi:hypothetical protein
MSTLKPWLIGVLVSTLLLAPWTAHVGASPGSAATTGGSSNTRDGQHDFDFEIGSWNIHLQRLRHPLSGSKEWVRFDGSSVTRKVWDGRSQLEEFETDGAGGHIEGLTLRLYNPQTHEWSLYWANSQTGRLFPPQIGRFNDGIGEFYGMDTQDGRTVLVRFIWSRTNTDTPHFEQAFSADGGRTWEVNWITDQTRTDRPSH